MGDYSRSDSGRPDSRDDDYGNYGESSPPADRKRRLEDPPAEQSTDRAPVSKRKRLEERHQRNRKRGQAPPSAYSRRDGDEPRPGSHQSAPPRSPSPLLPPRSPTPEAPARQRKRPGGGARMGLVDRETLRRRQEARERAEEEDAVRNSQSRGVTDIVRQHYNAVPQRGREWRKTESKIKGLRSFNNWVKSTLIQKFSPDEEFVTRSVGTKDWADGTGPPPTEEKRLLVIDLGCGKGGDLGKWQLAPQPVDLYVGLDPAEVSIIQARERYASMRTGRGPRGGRRGPLFHGEFRSKDCFGEWLGEVDIVQQVGIDPNAGPGGSVMSSRWGGGGFDVVASMFAIHYAFESEEKARQMLRNVAGALKKGGRFLGVCPNSDVISAQVAEVNAKRKNREVTKDVEPEDGEVEEDAKVEWGNSIYRVRFPGETPEDGIFRPPFGWKYSYFMEEAVGEIPEYVVPWEAFRALTEEYNLELQYRKPFLEVWRDEKDDAELGPLSERMGVRDRNTGDLNMTQEEQEAVSFYHAFCFYKV
ncbi:guanine-N(7)-methyltransferase [Aspergillus ellipticus CBS 707.79]|uniref:mRNA cap guanine-N(7) methyltransferase n=1 Tax=Aspergillus ellipticus CBS 707.79 TaxID=1448320 RepID=A0A319DNA3_9EURO|nr:guanine-N(7)-methyltransferase [Aspergillus ellipticus CBS 707.79]